MNIHIIIPSYNHWDLTHSLLWQLYTLEKENIHSITVIDNGSTDEEVAGGLEWWRTAELFKDFCPYKIEKNIGFLLSSNEVLRYYSKLVPKEDVLILLSNDVQIFRQFTGQIRELISTNSDSLVGGILYSQDTGWNNFNGRIFPYLEGWLLAATVANWEKLGYFDERYAPNDYEDVDLSTTAISLGFELFALNNPGLKHIGAQTIGYNPERMEQTKQNKKLFEEKWVKQHHH